MLMDPKRPEDYKKQYQKLSQKSAERGAMPPWMLKHMSRGWPDEGCSLTLSNAVRAQDSQASLEGLERMEGKA